ncbi:MAG: sigma-70 family RNA polymerase sigma factor [Prevotella sp.]|nr:sigma-70 family RNA polymerase sigma factor [Prevotella sp.]
MKKEEIEILFRQHYGSMIRLAMRMLYDDEESRDVVSEVFATLMNTDILPKNMEGYLMASVRNRCLNLLEHKDVRAKFEQAYTLEMKQNMVTDDDAFSYATVEQRLQKIMAYAKQHLTEQTLLVFRMRHINGMKYQEIADQIGISRVMVYKHLAKAMITIKEYNNQKEQDYGER